jgi:hypothetical protein
MLRTLRLLFTLILTHPAPESTTPGHLFSQQELMLVPKKIIYLASTRQYDGVFAKKW